LRRRELLILVAGTAITGSLAVRAQQKAMPVVGFLHSGPPTANATPNAEFRRGLGYLGFIEGHNIAFESRFAEGHEDRLSALAADLARGQVAVIVAMTFPSALAAKAATSTIPIVFWTGGDPVEQGLVASLARPGRNLTGFTLINNDLGSKRLEILQELEPKATVLALLVNPVGANTRSQSSDAQEAARAKGLQIRVLGASSEKEIETAFPTLIEDHADALIVASDPFLYSRREQLVALAARHAVPTIYTVRNYATLGGLISYAGSDEGSSHLLGTYTGRILKGEKPEELPVQQSTKFELVINLKTAKALGLTVPQSLLARADEVIE
jgi:putative ABC transport system substrate-binding protein